MSKRDKLVARLCALPADMDFEDVRRVLEMFGYKLKEKGTGSHRIFVGPDDTEVTVPIVSGRKVKRPYLQRIVQLLDLDSYLENQ